MSLSQRISICGNNFFRWGEELKKKFKLEIGRCRDRIAAMAHQRDSNSQQLVLEERARLNELLLKRKEYWQQRAKVHWLKAGDVNSKFFHAYATARRKKNAFLTLMDDDGIERTWTTGIPDMIQQYFTTLFTSSGSVAAPVLSTVSRKISAEQNMVLTRPFVAKEIKEAIMSMHPDKSPGPDGLNPCFYQSFWTDVGNRVTEECLDCLNNCRLPEVLNDTNIVLIPKVKAPMKLTDLRPISLCNVVVKIMTKVLANRLKVVLGDVISNSQSAFIPGRLISDNVHIAFELGHYLKRRNGKVGLVSLKIDMAKAYDRVEWAFLEQMMLKLGFAETWVKLIMLFVTTIRYTVKHPHGSVGPIFPSRGLRQGDPISPYLFLICAEGLSCLLQAYARQGLIHGGKVARTAPEITHLFFADDSLLFFNASPREGHQVKLCLNQYEEASGQMVNFNKSSIIFSNNTIAEVRDELCAILGVGVKENHGKYLGAPSLIGKNKAAVFDFIREKTFKRIHSWKMKFLSRAGKEVLLKSVVHAIPTYVMSIFLIPVSICKEVEKLMNKFWWSSSNKGEKGIHWKSWNKLCAKKVKGGLGFRKLQCFNLALLAKQSWKLVTSPSSLVARIYKARYYPDSDFLSAKMGSNPSYTWRSIIATQSMLKDGIRMRVGQGNSIKIWGHPWLNDTSNPYVESMPPPDWSLATVDMLKLPESNEWDVEVLSNLFSERDRSEIMAIPLSRLPYADKIYWVWDSKGNYSVKSSYNHLFSAMYADYYPAVTHWNYVWSMNIAHKIRNFLWRILSGCLPTISVLRIKQVAIDNCCPICKTAEEDAYHILVKCSFARRVWVMAGKGDHSGATDSFVSWWHYLCRLMPKKNMESIAVILWGLWQNRNAQVWRSTSFTPAALIRHNLDNYQQWIAANKHVQNQQTVDRALVGGKWQRPSGGRLKCNVDASVRRDFCDFGGILRDDNGSFRAAIRGTIRGHFTPVIAEALAMREVLSWLIDLNIQQVIIESDSQLLVHVFHSTNIDGFYLGLVVSDCKSLSSDIVHCEVNYVRRSANMAAHCLAGVEYFMSGQERWGDVPPPFLLDVLDVDLN